MLSDEVSSEEEYCVSLVIIYMSVFGSFFFLYIALWPLNCVDFMFWASWLCFFFFFLLNYTVATNYGDLGHLQPNTLKYSTQYSKIE